MLPMFFTVVILAFANLAIASPVPAPQEESSQVFALGVIIPKIEARTNRQQTYALYLPLKYSREKRWPVVYVFDPGARGQLALQHFQHAAELHGFIVAASNNSRNGPWATEYEAADAMAKDTQQRFATDLKHIYFAGFSGGARVASHLAQLCKCAAGVLLSGAGFSHGSPPSQHSPFAVFSAVGNADFNYSEIISLQGALEESGFPHWLRVFAGPHEWAPPNVMDEALAWFRIQSLTSQRAASPDDTFLSDEFAAGLVRAEALEHSGNHLAAWREYRQIATVFEAVTDVSAVRAKAALLERQKSWRDAAKREKNDFDEQDRLSSEILAASSSNRDNPAQTVPQQSAVALTKELRLRAASEKKPERALVFERALAGVFVGSMESGADALEKKDYSHSSQQFACAAEANPESEWALRSLAMARAFSGDRKGALEALYSAKKISKDPASLSDWLKQEHAFEQLRSSAEFQVLFATP